MEESLMLDQDLDRSHKQNSKQRQVARGNSFDCSRVSVDFFSLPTKQLRRLNKYFILTNFFKSVYHLRDLAQGKRRMIKSKDIKHLNVPLFEGLSTNDILEWAKDYPEVGRALPSEPREIDKLLRQYIINVVYTLVGDPFRQWVETVMQARDAKIIEQRSLGIELDPDILRVFRNSTSVSSKNQLRSLSFLLI